MRTIFAEVLEQEQEDIAETDTFVSLGGDSLSYVAATVRLERALGHIPHGWHQMPVCELSPAPPQNRAAAAPADSAGRPQHQSFGRSRPPWHRRMLAPMETGIVLRAVAIIFIVSTHIGFFHWEGTAHVLIAVAGYNFARFQLTGTRQARLRRQLRSVVRIVVPSVAVIGLAFAVTDTYTWANVFLLNSLPGPEGWTDYSRFWFVEILVHILIGLATLLVVPAVDRAQRRWPWAFALVLIAVDLPLLFGLVDSRYPGQGPVLWLFGLGWAAATSKNVWHRAAVTAIALFTVPESFEDQYRSATILVGFLILLWVPTTTVPRGLHRITALLASASLYISITHWLLYPLVGPEHKGLAVAASLAAGILYWAAATTAMGRMERWIRGRQRISARNEIEGQA
ncbi:acyl carrier protein [Arthrobacter sp. Leaf137]|uniref:acyl carrier protein n=1 Tax=Arthrobacter sp. Leaf137 TaxID=1736271 RepID=UPI000700803E|nr:acyl carrier protein [Arthrobacter sp. Leaf137]KQQ80932.1 hypothetical protein ASF64_12880 [Arthrobacter sp. Leaf137]